VSRSITVMLSASMMIVTAEPLEVSEAERQKVEDVLKASTRRSWRDS
jgi:hypothetical protein